MMSRSPAVMGNVSDRERNMEIMRTAIIAELDAISLYEQLAASTDNLQLRTVLLDVAREEKTHFGEFQTMLLRLDIEQDKELEKAKDEIREKLEKKG